MKFRTLALVVAATAQFCSVHADPRTPAETRAAFLKIIDRPRVPLEAREQPPESSGDCTLIKFSYASESTQRVPGILIKPRGDEARRPAVIVLHGTGGKKEDEIGLLKQSAAKGMVGVSIDGRYHGERGTQADYNAAIARTFETGEGHPFYWDTVWDVLRLIDYLQTRPDIDPKRIGLMGFSKGGIETYFASAADERIAVAVPCIGVQSFKWALENDRWSARVGTIKKAFEAAAKSAGVAKPDTAFTKRFYDRVVPGIDTDFDGPVMLTLICPRPLLIINGGKDSLTPVEGVNLAADAARAAYKAAGAEDKFRQIIEPNIGHSVTTENRNEAVAWFEKWMK